ncbi:hypothetical protein KQX54_002627 [Cotesia glomerata]|uniref:Uncharacterized protein n=1 Tax=Cotesia glomerata TaxID=32391 RepID=A0AAV7IUF9_COTGL|nr:hypothetical protein KQX54_002627 [Cotesia glomerata]
MCMKVCVCNLPRSLSRWLKGLKSNKKSMMLMEKQKKLFGLEADKELATNDRVACDKNNIMGDVKLGLTHRGTLTIYVIFNLPRHDLRATTLREFRGDFRGFPIDQGQIGRHSNEEVFANGIEIYDTLWSRSTGDIGLVKSKTLPQGSVKLNGFK